MIIFLPSNLNICFGCSKEPFHQKNCLIETQHMFWLRNKNNNFRYPHFSWDLQTSNPLSTSGCFLLIWYNKLGWFIVYIEGSHVMLYFFLWRSFLSKQTVYTQLKCCIMGHNIWAFAVRQRRIKVLYRMQNEVATSRQS